MKQTTISLKNKNNIKLPYPTFPETILPPFDVSNTLKINGDVLNFNGTIKFLISAFGDISDKYFINLPSNYILSYKVTINKYTLDKKVILYENIVREFTNISNPIIDNFTRINIPSILFCKLKENIPIELEVNISPEFSGHDFSTIQLFVEYKYYNKTNIHKIEEVKNIDTVYDSFVQQQYFSSQLSANSQLGHEVILPFFNLIKGIIIRTDTHVGELGLFSHDNTKISSHSVIGIHPNTYYFPVNVFVNVLEPITVKFNTPADIRLDVIALSENVLIYQNDGTTRFGYQSIFQSVVPV